MSGDQARQIPALEIVFLRHAATLKVEGQSDFDRKLSDTGVAQAEARRNTLGDSPFQLVITSSAERTRETARHITDLSKATVVSSPVLYPTGEKLERSFARLKYAPYGVYASDEEGQCVIGIGQVMASEITRTIAAFRRSERVLVVGHAVLLTATFCAMAPWLSEDDFKTVAEYPLQEVEGYILRTFVEHGHQTSSRPEFEIIRG